MKSKPNILEIPPTPEALARYGSLPMSIDVRSMFAVEPVEGGLGGFLLRECPVDPPYIKDYDEDGGRPVDWATTFDVSNWGFFLAMRDELLAGAATVAFNTNGVNMLEGRPDVGVLWDIRVHPDFARQGVGSTLFAYAVGWLRERRCVRLKIETQNINVGACRFYRARGCELGAISRFAYHEPKVAHETLLMWYLELDGMAHGSPAEAEKRVDR